MTTPPHSPTRRPTDITVIGWFFVVFGFASFLSGLVRIGAAGSGHRLVWQPLTPSEWLAPEGIRLIAFFGGIALLARWTGARWVLLAWMLFHIGLSLFHGLGPVVVHVTLAVVTGYLLFRPASRAYFRT